MRSIFTGILRIAAVDWAVLALLVFEIPSLFYSQLRANSVGTTESVALAVAAYFLLRLLVRTPLRAAGLAALAGLGGAWLAVAAILEFAAGSAHLREAGITDFVAFRSRFIHPLSGWTSGECFAVFLLALPFICGATAWLWRIEACKGRSWRALPGLLPALPVLAALFLSLSRAVFWSMIFFFVIAYGLMAVYKVIHLRRAFFLLAGTVAVMVLILAGDAALYPGILKVYGGGHSSQVRSTQGRIGIWSRLVETTQDHRWWGVGSANTGLLLLSSADQEETTGFASRAFSLPLQLLGEKGVFGLAVYAVLLLLAGRQFHRGMRLREREKANAAQAGAKRQPVKLREDERIRLLKESAHRAMKCCFAAGLAAMLLRELIYSSLLEHALTMVLALALTALMCAEEQPDGLRMMPVTAVVCAVVLLLQWPYNRFTAADARLKEFFGQVALNNLNSARENIDAAIALWPWNSRYYGWRGYLAGRQLPTQCPRNGRGGTGGLNSRDKALAEQAVEDYRHALSLNERDAVARQNLAWLEHLLGDDASASKDWRAAIEIDPDNAAFHLSYGMFLEEGGGAQAAQEQYETAIELLPKIVDSPFFTRYQDRSPQGADAVVKAGIARLESKAGQGNDPILEARLGKLYLKTGEIERSGKMLEEAVEQLPNLPLVWFNLGEYYAAQGDTAQALICYQKAQAIDVFMARPWLRLGEMALQSGRPDSAKFDLNMAVQGWQHIMPGTAAHNNRLYNGPAQTINDLLPATLVWYISPCEASEAWRALSRTDPQNAEYMRGGSTCESLPAPHGGQP
jgi:tetratricopeptide (TPR) repeat protein